MVIELNKDGMITCLKRFVLFFTELKITTDLRVAKFIYKMRLTNKMSKKGTLAGIVIAVAAIAGVIVYTNIDELAKPGVESSIDTAKEVASKVEGKDVVSKAEEVASEVKNVTSKIEIQNPLEPKK